MIRQIRVVAPCLLAGAITASAHGAFAIFDSVDPASPFEASMGVGFNGLFAFDEQTRQKFVTPISGPLESITFRRVRQDTDYGPLQIEVREANAGPSLGFVDVPYADVPPTWEEAFTVDLTALGASLVAGAEYEVVLRMTTPFAETFDSGFGVAFRENPGLFPIAELSDDGGATWMDLAGAIEQRVVLDVREPVDEQMRVIAGASPSTVFDVDTLLPFAFEPTAVDDFGVSGVEAFDHGRTAYHAASADAAAPEPLFVVDPATGAVTRSVSMTFPPGDPVEPVSALEFVGATLHGAFGSIPVFATIDTQTGVMSRIGDMNLPAPCAGLAWDGATMYAVTGGAGGALYTVDLATGLATLVDTILDLDTGAGVQLVGLEFGQDGLLYAMSDAVSRNELYVVDPVTAIATPVGPLRTSSLEDLADMTVLDNCPADLNGDKVVDGADLGELLGSWGGFFGDLNGDGVTDGADLGILLGAWGPC